MKPLPYFSILSLSLLSQGVAAANLPGTYESAEAIDCALRVTVSSRGDRYFYHLKTSERDARGTLQSENEENVINFMGLRADYPEKTTVSALYLDGAILIQNYGNAMNEYTFLSECDQKYIELHKARSEAAEVPKEG